MQLLRPADVLLLGVALLAALFFVGGVMEAFEDYRGAARRRRRRQRRCRAPSPLTDPGKEPADSPPESRRAVPPMVANVAWPAPRPTPPSPTPLHGSSGLSRTGTDGEADERVGPEHSSPDDLEHGKMVVHYANGRVIKGYSYDFHPNKPLFHLLPPVAGFSFTDEAIEVRLKDLKAVFFVRDFVGDPSYNERKEFLNGQRPLGQKVAVTFPDGETLVGSTMGYDRKRVGFFLTPADPKSNNLRAFVISRTATRIRFL